MKTRIFGDTPCFEGARWLRRQPDQETAWKKCKRADWMLWALMNTPDGCLITRENSLKVAKFALEKVKLAVEAAKETDYRIGVRWSASVMEDCVNIIKKSDEDYGYSDLYWAEEAERAITACDDAWCDAMKGKDFLKEAADYLRELFPTFPEAK